MSAAVGSIYLKELDVLDIENESSSYEASSETSRGSDNRQAL